MQNIKIILRVRLAFYWHHLEIYLFSSDYIAQASDRFLQNTDFQYNNILNFIVITKQYTSDLFMQKKF